MDSLGIIYDDIGKNPEKDIYLYHMLNDLSAKGINCCIFTNFEVMGPIKNRFSVFQQVGAFGFKGTLVASDIKTAIKLDNCFGTDKKFLYVWELDYMNGQYSYEVIKKVYKNKDIEIIVRNENYEKIIKNIFNRTPKYRGDRWNIEGILK